jgi:hypothetical protein
VRKEAEIKFRVGPLIGRTEFIIRILQVLVREPSKFSWRVGTSDPQGDEWQAYFNEASYASRWEAENNKLLGIEMIPIEWDQLELILKDEGQIWFGQIACFVEEKQVFDLKMIDTSFYVLSIPSDKVETTTASLRNEFNDFRFF